MIFYSAEAGGFYDSGIVVDMPNDLVEITPAQHAALFEGQGRGERIVADADGRPVLQKLTDVERAAIANAPVLAQITAIEQTRQPRAQRDFALTGDKTRLQVIDNDIQALRAQLVQ